MQYMMVCLEQSTGGACRQTYAAQAQDAGSMPAGMAGKQRQFNDASEADQRWEQVVPLSTAGHKHHRIWQGMHCLSFLHCNKIGCIN
jgi:endonuclease I